jgi:SAM-dependent methyltransferase
MSEFDSRAQTWDDPMKIRRAEAVANTMRRIVPLARTMRTLEYGAGTGLLSFSLREVAAQKIAAAQAGDMRVLDLDLMRDPIPAERYDLIMSLMTLHHVPDVPRVLAAFHDMLNAGGWLCIADLDAEDGSFHGEGVDVHHGFERDALRSWLAQARFADVRIDDCFNVDKGGRRYPVFLASARKA